MTDTETTEAAPEEAGERPVEEEERSLLPQAYDTLAELVSCPPEMRLEQMLAMGEDGRTELALAVGRGYRMSKALMGQLAHAERLSCGPGEWTKRARVLAMAMGVSGQTVQRNLQQYLRENGLELPVDQTQWGGARERSSTLDAIRSQVDGIDGYTYTTDGDPVENAARFRETIGEAWGEEDTAAGPSTKYENAEPAAVHPLLASEPPPEWLDQEVAAIIAEYPAFDRVGAERNAKAKWNRLEREQASRADALSHLDEDTLIELMAEVQDMDPEAALEDVRTAAEDAWVKVYAESSKAKPENAGDVQVVKKPKSQGKGKVGPSASKNIENGMVYAREVHQHVVKLLEEGGAEMLFAEYGPTIIQIQGWGHAVDGILTKVRQAKEKVALAEKRAAAVRPVVDVAAGDEF